MIDFTYNPIIPADYKSPRERTSLRSLSLGGLLFCCPSPHTAGRGASEGKTFAGFSLKMRPIAPNGALQAFCRRQNLGTGGIHFRRARSIPLGWSGGPPRNPKIKDRRWGTLRKEGAPMGLLYLNLICSLKRCNPCGYAVFSLLRWARCCWKASSISSGVSSWRMPTPL